MPLKDPCNITLNEHTHTHTLTQLPFPNNSYYMCISLFVFKGCFSLLDKSFSFCPGRGKSSRSRLVLLSLWGPFKGTLQQYPKRTHTHTQPVGGHPVDEPRFVSWRWWACFGPCGWSARPAPFDSSLRRRVTVGGNREPTRLTTEYGNLGSANLVCHVSKVASFHLLKNSLLFSLDRSCKNKYV